MKMYHSVSIYLLHYALEQELSTSPMNIIWMLIVKLQLCNKPTVY